MSPVLFWFEQCGRDLITAITSRPDKNNGAELRHHPALQRRLDQLWRAFGPRRRQIQRSEYVTVYLLICKALGVLGSDATLLGHRNWAIDLVAIREKGMTRIQFQDSIFEIVGQCAAAHAAHDYCKFLKVLADRILCPAPLSYLPLAEVRKPTLQGPGRERQTRLRRVSSAPILGRRNLEMMETPCDLIPIRMAVAATKAIPPREFTVPLMTSASRSPTESGFRGWAKLTKTTASRPPERPKTAVKRRQAFDGPIDLIGSKTLQIRIDAVALKHRPRSSPGLSRSLSLAEHPRSVPNSNFCLQSCQVKLSFS